MFVETLAMLESLAVRARRDIWLLRRTGNVAKILADEYWSENRWLQNCKLSVLNCTVGSWAVAIPSFPSFTTTDNSQTAQPPQYRYDSVVQNVLLPVVLFTTVRTHLVDCLSHINRRVSSWLICECLHLKPSDLDAALRIATIDMTTLAMPDNSLFGSATNLIVLIKILIW